MVNLIQKPTDGRRAKNRQRNAEQIPLLESLQIQIDQRPAPLYDEYAVIRTPLGYRRVSMRYHSNISGWQYQVLLKIEHLDRPRPYYRTYTESDLKPITFKPGQVVVLPNKTKMPIAAIGLSPNFKLLIGFEVRHQCYSWYSEDDIYQHNPELVTDEYALSQLYKAYVKECADKELAIKFCMIALPELENA